MRVRDILKESQAVLGIISDSPHLEAEILLSYVMNMSREQLIANFDKEIEKTLEISFFDLIKERAKKVPLYYILGKKSFMGLEFSLDRNVLIPRAETETLVEKALEVTSGNSITLLDIGTGSGCILISFLYYNKVSKGFGIDISKGAIDIARENAKKYNLLNRAEFIVSDFSKLEASLKFDMILSNPPYVKSDELKNVPYEPSIALDGGSNGYEIYPSLVRKIYELLDYNGVAIVEIDYRFSDFAKSIFLKNNFNNVSLLKDLSGKNRFVSGTK